MAGDRFDVAIIGGGPAGSCLAGFLAKRGVSVALIEAERHPRYAVGESLLPQAWRYLEELGVAASVERAEFVRKKGVTTLWGGELRQFEFAWFGCDRDPLLVDRDRFDGILFAHAASLGVSVFEKTRAISMVSRADCKIVLTEGPMGAGEISCSILVDASGRSGVIARQSGARQIYSDDGTVFLWGYFEGGRFILPGGRAKKRDVSVCQEATSYMCETETGWALHLPLRKSSFVGFASHSDHLPGNPTDLEAYYLRTITTLPNFAMLLDGALYSPGSFRYAKEMSFSASSFAEPGIFLVGDAAGYSDPIFAHGVQFALFSAYAASNAIVRSLTADDATPIVRYYDGQIRQHHQMSLAMARGVRMTFPGLLHWLPQDELDLIATASAVTGRSANFQQMASVANVNAAERYRVLCELQAD